MALQLHPITLLNTNYKLLTKMTAARLLPLLPSVLKATKSDVPPSSLLESSFTGTSYLGICSA
jgi:hypothetical protein